MSTVVWRCSTMMVWLPAWRSSLVSAFSYIAGDPRHPGGTAQHRCEQCSDRRDSDHRARRSRLARRLPRWGTATTGGDSRVTRARTIRHRLRRVGFVRWPALWALDSCSNPIRARGDGGTNIVANCNPGLGRATQCWRCLAVEIALGWIVRCASMSERSGCVGRSLIWRGGVRRSC